MGCFSCGRKKNYSLASQQHQVKRGALANGKCPYCASYVTRKARRLPDGSIEHYFKCTKGHETK